MYIAHSCWYALVTLLLPDLHYPRVSSFIAIIIVTVISLIFVSKTREVAAIN